MSMSSCCTATKPPKRFDRPRTSMLIDLSP
jgi:hypothetical protein